jgi:SAM-dependent methyltransferase
MAQDTRGLKALLSSPLLYRLLQNLLGANRTRIGVSEDYFRLDNVNRVLDIGCGTADILDVLPDRVEYVGFDASADYIDYAKKRYAHRKATFYARKISDSDPVELGKFDLVLAFGILHHLDDEDAIALFRTAKMVLSNGGQLFTIDPCIDEAQSKMSKTLIGLDRGRNVRTLNRYFQLASEAFQHVESHHRTDLLRVPYDHTVMLCR